MSVIEVRGLKKSFDALEVLRGIDLTVEEGERIANDPSWPTYDNLGRLWKDLAK